MEESYVEVPTLTGQEIWGMWHPEKSGVTCHRVDVTRRMGYIKTDLVAHQYADAAAFPAGPPSLADYSP
jgi:hypothetical protein